MAHGLDERNAEKRPQIEDGRARLMNGRAEETGNEKDVEIGFRNNSMADFGDSEQGKWRIKATNGDSDGTIELKNTCHQL